MSGMARILVVDNYDSFVYNLVQYLQQLGADCTVLRNDELEPGDVTSYDGVLLSPGPGTPVGRADELLHGKTSLVYHDGAGVLAGLPSPFTATRYHSLAIQQDTVPDVLEITGRTDAGIIMAARHRDLPVEGVQFHPESVLTEGGHRMLANWLTTCGDPNAIANSTGLAPVVS